MTASTRLCASSKMTTLSFRLIPKDSLVDLQNRRGFWVDFAAKTGGLYTFVQQGGLIRSFDDGFVSSFRSSIVSEREGREDRGPILAIPWAGTSQHLLKTGAFFLDSFYKLSRSPMFMILVPSEPRISKVYGSVRRAS